MPQIQVLPDNQRGRGNVLEALGKGLGEGIADLSQRSLAQKMDLLKQQKQMDMQRQYVSQYAQNLRKLGGDFVPFADAYEATGGNETLAKMFVEYGLGGGQQSPRQAASEGYGMGPMQQPQPFQPGQMEETIPIQDREAVEDIAPMAQAPKVPEDFKYKIAPNYDRLRGPAKEKVDRSAEREFNAAIALRKEKREIDTLKGKRFEKPISNILTHAEDAEKLIPNFEVAIAQNEKMKTSPATWDAMVTSMADQYPWLSNFKSSNAQILEAQTPAFIADFKGKMGGVLTDAKINLISKKVAGVGKNKDANRLILHLGYLDKKLDIARAEKANEIIRENDDMVPSDFDIRLKSAMYPIQKDISEDISALLSGKRPTSDFSKSSLEEGKKETVKTLSNEGYAEGDTAYNTKTGKRYIYSGGRWVMEK